MSTKSCEINLMTYNVWFDELHTKPRMQRILEIISENKVDILALQEITVANLKYLIPGLKAQGFNIQHQRLSRFYLGDYGVLIASKFPILDVKQQQFESIMGRQMIYILVNLPDNTNGVFGVVHLESGVLGMLEQASVIRKQQLASAFKTLTEYRQSVVAATGTITSIVALMGDTNWRDPTKTKHWDGLMSLPQGWSDVETTPTAYTYDGPANQMLGNYLKFRPDRILVQTEKPWRSTCTKLVGTEPIPDISRKMKKGFNPVLPSDHFGLKATLTQRGKLRIKIGRREK